MGQYDSLSVPEISSLITELEEARRVKQGLMPVSQIRRMMDVNSASFMGSGMTFQEFMLAGELDRLKNAYWRQDREEKSRRRDAAVALAIEYAKILEQTHQATAFAREAIVEVINGDWREVKINRDMLAVDPEFVGLEPELAAIFVPFIKLLDEVLAGVPKQETPPQPVEAAS